MISHDKIFCHEKFYGYMPVCRNAEGRDARSLEIFSRRFCRFVIIKILLLAHFK